MRFYLSIVALLILSNVFSQEIQNNNVIDSLYREDQFYIGFTYNTLQNRPSGVNQNKFTPSFSLGFLRDMPINKNRNLAIATGIGYSINNYNQNILITDAVSGSSSNKDYTLLTSSFDKNKLTLHYIDLPIEFRWRTSTPESHIFWRIYTGFKISYLVYNRSKYTYNDEKIITIKNKDLNNFESGVYIAAGRNTWNFYMYYGLNPIFEKAILDYKSLKMNSLNIGLQFYIL